MTQKIEVQARAPKDPDGTFERVGSDEEGHEYLIDLYFDSPEQANGTMADRFPSLDDFAAGQTEPKGNGTVDLDGIEGDDDFLQRERAALGDDANQFASTNDNAATVEDGDADDDLLGGSYNDAGGAGGEDLTDFESSFPSVDTRNEGVAPGGTITGSDIPFRSNDQSQPSYGAYAEEEEEPEPIRLWRESRDERLRHQDEEDAEKTKQTREGARQYIDDFYENYNAKKEKQIARTRKEAEEFLEKREDTSSGGTSWERIAKLVDLSGKGAKGGAAGGGKEKFKQLLLDLRKDENAPGASGYASEVK
ncbi:clathrin light chain [Physcia stellaris]|nr:clathrin light chain [Physcia stellaris]